MRLIVQFKFILLLSFISLEESFADCTYSMFMHVTAPSGLSIRKEPTSNSEKITSVPYWDIVAVNDCPYLEVDQIDGLLGRWRKVKYNNIEGYMYGGYLVKNEAIKTSFRIMRQGFSGERPSNFDPSFHWYGLYKKGQYYALKEITVTLLNDYPCYGCEASSGLQIETNNDSSSLFLIGSKTELKTEGLIKSYIKNATFNYPGQRAILHPTTNQAKTLQLYTTGTVTDVRRSAKMKNYELRISEYNRSLEDTTYQNISKDIRYFGPGISTALSWCGDVNNDGLMDLFFSSTGQGFSNTLLIGDDSITEKFVRYAASF